MTRLSRKRGDTGPFEARLTLNGAAENLDGTSVRFLMAPAVAGEGPAVAAAAEVLQTGVAPDYADKGRVRYAPAAGDVGTAGVYRQEWEVTFGDGTVQTYPSSGAVDVVISADLG